MTVKDDHRTEASVKDPTLHLPRILCLHGGGTNARIFRTQCRVLESRLRSRFRLCFAEAPFSSEAGPDVLSVYKDWGPFRRWLLSHHDHPEKDASATFTAIEQALTATMNDDDYKGATGAWVALMGFSQGARLAASLLLRQQVHAETPCRQRVRSSFRFAVLMAGRGPLIPLDPWLVTKSAVADNFGRPGAGDSHCRLQGGAGVEGIVLRLPTIHVHGLRDPGLKLHRQMLEQCCENDSTRLVEWDGDHRLPIKTKDVSQVVEAIMAVAMETGILN